MKSVSRTRLIDALKSSWSLESSSKWTQDNPALGQCGVTALVVQDVLGGEILKTKYGEIWHFYNLIDDEPVDFTKSQFAKPIVYSNHVSNREEAFSDTNAEQYGYLRAAVQKHLQNI
ncbi:MAG: hypothetical protein AAGF95_15340 [Chloroflexota bacterium]